MEREQEQGSGFGPLEEERQTMGDRWFRQEYCCEFGEAEGSLFDEELIRKAIRDDLKPLEFRRW